MRMIIRTFFSSSIIVCLSNVSGMAQTVSTMPVLKIDASHVTAHVSPIHAGLMTEEINHSYDGGLYAELIRTRSFNQGVTPAVGALPSWSLVKDGVTLDVTGSLSAAMPVSLRFDVITASRRNRVGVASGGLCGLPGRPATRCRASFYRKADGMFPRPLLLSI